MFKLKEEIAFSTEEERQAKLQEVKDNTLCDMKLTMTIRTLKDGTLSVFSEKSDSVDTMEEFHALPIEKRQMHECCARILQAVSQMYGAPVGVYGRTVRH